VVAEACDAASEARVTGAEARDAASGARVTGAEARDAASGAHVTGAGARDAASEARDAAAGARDATAASRVHGGREFPASSVGSPPNTDRASDRPPMAQRASLDLFDHCAHPSSMPIVAESTAFH